MIGMAYPAISEKNFFLGQLPLPPCSEQRAIVQRVDHLMQHCDAYEAEQNMRESARQKAVKANFNTLSNSSAVEMQEHWERVKNHFGDLYKTTGDVAELKAAILQLAVRGELTRDWREQNPDVEPASVLLEKIKVEKQKLEKGGQIRKQKTLPLVSEEEAPYEIGATWKWVRWGDISHDIQYGFTAKADFSISEVCYLRITDIQEDAVNWSSVPGCEIESNQIDLYRLNEGDLVVARTGGTIGKTYLVKGVSDFNAIFASYLIRISVSTLNIPKYVKLFSLSSTYWDQLYEGSKGTGQPNVNGRTLGSILFPLPPQSEQKVIVKRVNQLMQLSDEFDRVKKQVVSIGNNLLKSIGANM
jgi:type I restriction enzyme S subunit